MLYVRWDILYCCNRFDVMDGNPYIVFLMDCRWKSIYCKIIWIIHGNRYGNSYTVIHKIYFIWIANGNSYGNF